MLIACKTTYYVLLIVNIMTLLGRHKNLQFCYSRSKFLLGNNRLVSCF